MPDAKRVEEATERLRFRRLNRCDQGVRSLVGVPLETEQLITREGVKIARVFHKSLIHELLDPRVRKSADIHRPTRREMHQAFQLSPWTHDVRTVNRRLVFLARNGRSTDGTFLWHPPRPLVPGPPLRNRRDDLRYHFASALHLHPVADAQVLGDD